MALALIALMMGIAERPAMQAQAEALAADIARVVHRTLRPAK